MSVRFAVGLPNVGEFGDARTLLELAVAAEAAGWDGVYLWDHVLHHEAGWPVANTVVAASAIAAATVRIRFGVLMTALPRRRVQTVARETATLDRLSGGRLVFGAGIGSMDREYSAFGEDPDLRVRAARLDESLAALDRLWSGEPVSYQGRYVRVDDVTLYPGPVQRPRIPVWCPGRWPVRAGLRRAARWDGAMPTFAAYGRDTRVPVEVFAEVAGFLRAERAGRVPEGADPLAGFDVAMEGWTRPGEGAEVVRPYAEAGLTWWIEAMGWWRGGVAEARERIAAGPPTSP